jgi:hypothetical protein
MTFPGLQRVAGTRFSNSSSTRRVGALTEIGTTWKVSRFTFPSLQLLQLYLVRDASNDLSEIELVHRFS